jgi:hypothetical protein
MTRYDVIIRDGYRYNALVITATVTAESPAEAIPLALNQACRDRGWGIWEPLTTETNDDGTYAESGRIVGHYYPVLVTVKRHESPWRHTRTRRMG